MAITGSPFSPPAAPFDAVADTYDETFTSSQIGRTQRDAVTSEFDHVFRPGQRILEINCGTGFDAVFLGRHGVKVLACDSSPRMIEVARRRAAQSGVEHCVDFRVLASERIGALTPTEGMAGFDGLLSNFGGLNCIKDLSAVAGDLARLLKPGAPALLCVFGRSCLWEVLWYLGQGNATQAFRRFGTDGSLARLGGGVTIRVHYPSVREIARAFTPHFSLRHWKGVGVAVPPSYMEPWVRRFPRILKLLAEADRGLGRCPLIKAVADHVLLTFGRKSAPRYEIEGSHFDS
ncbi:MAG TPA: class I SAM-dependent methyltransferase [Terriglobia bacterium]